MKENEKREQWRMILAEFQAKQLARLPLCALETPLLWAQYAVALRFFQERSTRHAPHSQPELWRADIPTRRAFFDCFGFTRTDAFCVQEGFEELPVGPRNNSTFYPFARCSHQFSPLENDECTLEYRWRPATRGGFGSTDLWRFDGEKLIFVRNESAWVS